MSTSPLRGPDGTEIPSALPACVPAETASRDGPDLVDGTDPIDGCVTAIGSAGPSDVHSATVVLPPPPPEAPALVGPSAATAALPLGFPLGGPCPEETAGVPSRRTTPSAAVAIAGWDSDWKGASSALCRGCDDTDGASRSGAGVEPVGEGPPVVGTGTAAGVVDGADGTDATGSGADGTGGGATAGAEDPVSDVGGNNTVCGVVRCGASTGGGGGGTCSGTDLEAAEAGAVPEVPGIDEGDEEGTESCRARGVTAGVWKNGSMATSSAFPTGTAGV